MVRDCHVNVILPAKGFADGACREIVTGKTMAGGGHGTAGQPGAGAKINVSGSAAYAAVTAAGRI